MSDQCGEILILVCEQRKSIPPDIGALGVIVKVSLSFAFFVSGGCKDLYVIFLYSFPTLV